VQLNTLELSKKERLAELKRAQDDTLRKIKSETDEHVKSVRNGHVHGNVGGCADLLGGAQADLKKRDSIRQAERS
jgi:hypothetical protein